MAEYRVDPGMDAPDEYYLPGLSYVAVARGWDGAVIVDALSIGRDGRFEAHLAAWAPRYQFLGRHVGILDGDGWPEYRHHWLRLRGILPPFPA